MEQIKCVKRDIRNVYIFSTILWILILISLCMHELTIPDYLILAIPVFLFIVAISSQRSSFVEEYTSKTNVLATGLLVALPLLIWLRDNAICNKHLFNKVIVTSLILSLFSMVDIWVSKRYICSIRHLKSSFQTMALVLLAFAFFRFYMECPTTTNTIK